MFLGQLMLPKAVSTRTQWPKTARFAQSGSISCPRVRIFGRNCGAPNFFAGIQGVPLPDWVFCCELLGSISLMNRTFARASGWAEAQRLPVSRVRNVRRNFGTKLNEQYVS